MLEHVVEGVGELAKLVPLPGEPDPVRQGAGACQAGRIGNLPERREHVPREKPAARETDDEEKQEDEGSGRREGAQQVSAVRDEAVVGGDRAVWHVAQEERPDDGEQQAAREHEEPRVAQGQSEADAEALLPRHCSGRPRLRRCDSRLPAPWR